MDEKQKERLRTATIEVLLAIRAAYLASPKGNALKNWEVLQTRMRAATRTCASPEEWVTSICRSLHLPPLNSSACSALIDLVAMVRERTQIRAWLALLENDDTYILALARRIAEERKEKRSGNQTV